MIYINITRKLLIILQQDLFIDTLKKAHSFKIDRIYTEDLLK